MINQPYEISSEMNLTEALSHFDSEYIFDIIRDKLDNFDYSTVLEDPNIVKSFEENFKLMNENYPGDSQNIALIRTQVYNDIISILCERFNLQYNIQDDNIDIYAAAYYLYDFLVCNRMNAMITFFVSFIINNKDSVVSYINLDEYRKAKEGSASYSKHIYIDPKYGAISANMNTVLQVIAGMDIRIENIFQSVYTNYSIVEFMCNIVMDKGNFFKDFYCSLLYKPDVLPIIITHIRLEMQRILGDISQQNISDIIETDLRKQRKKRERMAAAANNEELPEDETEEGE